MMTVFGPVKFVSYGKETNQNKLPTYLVQWIKGKLELVWPEARDQEVRLSRSTAEDLGLLMPRTAREVLRCKGRPAEGAARPAPDRTSG